MKTKNITLLVNNLLKKEVGEVFGSDVTYKGENAFLLEAENDEIKIKVVISSETK